MQEITKELLEEDSYFLYIQTPFCGTCHVAKSMLRQIESAHAKNVFYEMNASLYPDFMQENRIESVPCLLIKNENVVQEKIYAFQSIPNIYQHLVRHKPEVFLE